MTYKSEDVKKMNGVILLKELYRLSDATMGELMQKKHFSQSLVRSLLKDLESKERLMVKNIDRSSGGRYPTRYTFNKAFFHVLSVFIGEGTVDFVLKDIFDHILFQTRTHCQLDQQLEKRIIEITQTYPVNCISIASRRGLLL